MPGTEIQDLRNFDDVVQLLESHPEWLARLRPILFTKELLALPEQISRLAEQTTVLGAAQVRTDARLPALRYCTEFQLSPPFVLFIMPLAVPTYRVSGVWGSMANASMVKSLNSLLLADHCFPAFVLLNTP